MEERKAEINEQAVAVGTEHLKTIEEENLERTQEKANEDAEAAAEFERLRLEEE